jgi:inosine-uridine nucleoside N-ribohydrolase
MNRQQYLPGVMPILYGLILVLATSGSRSTAAEPVRLIFDTDIGNDVDDALALGLIHALESRGECQLLAVTITKDHELSAPLVDAINTFYGRGHIPIGVVRDGPTPEASKFTILANQKDNGRLRYPHDLQSGTDAPEATQLLRTVLSGQPDRSVVIVQVGFSTNMARLLDSEPDQQSDLSGRELVRRKVKLLSVMAGSFQPIKGKKHLEYNVVKDIPSAKKLANEWPTPILYSGFEIGLAITYPARSIERDYRYVTHHPLAEAYQLYMPPPHNRPTWDLTSVLQVVRPDRQYFDLSEPGRITIEEDGGSRFVEEAGGPHRHLIASAEQVLRVREVLVHLASEPPTLQSDH